MRAPGWSEAWSECLAELQVALHRVGGPDFRAWHPPRPPAALRFRAGGWLQKPNTHHWLRSPTTPPRTPREVADGDWIAARGSAIAVVMVQVQVREQERVRVLGEEPPCLQEVRPVSASVRVRGAGLVGAPWASGLPRLAGPRASPRSAFGFAGRSPTGRRLPQSRVLADCSTRSERTQAWASPVEGGVGGGTFRGQNITCLIPLQPSIFCPRAIKRSSRIAHANDCEKPWYRKRAWEWFAVKNKKCRAGLYRHPPNSFSTRVSAAERRPRARAFGKPLRANASITTG